MIVEPQALTEDKFTQPFWFNDPLAVLASEQEGNMF